MIRWAEIPGNLQKYKDDCIQFFLTFFPGWNAEVLLNSFKHKDDTVRQDYEERQDRSHLGPRMNSWKRPALLALLIVGETNTTALNATYYSKHSCVKDNNNYIFFSPRLLRGRLLLFSKRKRNRKWKELSNFQPERAISIFKGLYSSISLPCCNTCNLFHALTTFEIVKNIHP